MVNPYDSAHQLAKVLKESSEYKEFVESSNKVKAHSETLKQIHDFFQKQMTLEMKIMTGEAPEESEVKELEDLYKLIQLHPDGLKFLNDQSKFQRLMSDIMKIVNESVSEATKIFTERV